MPTAPKKKPPTKKAAKRPTYTVKVDGATAATTPHRDLALSVAGTYYAGQKNVSVTDNAARRQIARFVYGHLQ